jgi:large subunit ribosomal protein L3
VQIIRDSQNTFLFINIAKVEPQRNLLYVRGQVPGPAGQFVYLRDAYCCSRDEKATWGLPFPTFVGDPASLPTTVFKTPKDPYRSFSEETDYFPIEWKKGD